VGFEEVDLKAVMEKRRAQIPLVCHGHSRPIVDLSYSPITPDGFFLVSASKGKPIISRGTQGLYCLRVCVCIYIYAVF